MLAFITSLRHPQNSLDYSRVEALLQRTLRSVCSQSVPDFRVIVVGNIRPKMPHLDRVDFVHVDFPPPSSIGGPETGRQAVLRDKGSKLAVALIAAQKYSPEFVMKVDADDFVSHRLAGHLRDCAGENGFIVETGYMLSERTGLIRPLSAFDQHCGTSEIIANRLYNLPDILPPTSCSQDDLYDTLGETFVEGLMGSHLVSRSFFGKNGSDLRALPFPGAIYTLGTGENHSGRRLMGMGRRPSPSLITEFGLDDFTYQGSALDFMRGGGESVAKFAANVRRSSFRQFAKVRGRFKSTT